MHKHLVGRPCKCKVVLQSKKKIKLQPIDIVHGGRGKYCNWFQPHLCPPIVEAIKKYSNNMQALRYLQTTFRSLGILSPYENISRGSLWTWFTKDGNLRDNYLHAVE